MQLVISGKSPEARDELQKVELAEMRVKRGAIGRVEPTRKVCSELGLTPKSGVDFNQGWPKGFFECGFYWVFLNEKKMSWGLVFGVFFGVFGCLLFGFFGFFLCKRVNNLSWRLRAADREVCKFAIWAKVWQMSCRLPLPLLLLLLIY
jgi:hypothetical protein